jgi:hypothetical protein
MEVLNPLLRRRWIAPREPGGFAAPPGVGDPIGLDTRTHKSVADRMYFNGKISSQMTGRP